MEKQLANGVIGEHPASCPQLLVVVNGQGWVRGESGEDVPVTVGDAVFWSEGEMRKTHTVTGLTAIIIEADGLDPARYMA